ncbi:serine--tRNA ligase, mitochondrial [Aplysia californica]|uniref:serine--tRNA ligase n=1 Tax=Aplysia californica TaxID=6500 RepID=A0ABM1VRY2_APLCA|nr:serine--tRNA ligase, mitochondrial [Aplysia californica]XP_035825174.1 serine--tRNA ligase, mitochondrial [Aplysia californica]
MHGIMCASVSVMRVPYSCVFKSGKLQAYLRHAVYQADSQHTLISQLASCLAMTTRRFSIHLKPHQPQDRKSLLKLRCSPRSVRHTAIQSKNGSDGLSPAAWTEPFKLPEPQLDWSYLLDKKNTETIAANIYNRKGIGDIHKLITLSELYAQEQNAEKKEALRQEMTSEALDIPNISHPETIVGDESCARQVEVVGDKKDFDFKPRPVSELGGKGLKMLRDRNLTFSTGTKTYYLEADLAQLERALVNFTLDFLQTKGFEYVTVPDVLHSGVIDSCGFKTSLAKSQVYHLHPDCLKGACLAGTAEMSLAGYFMNEVVPMDHLPARITAASRCYRAEATEKAVEKGLYRVHHFTKVEMFGLSADEDGTESNELLHDFLDIERELFSLLGLHFRILDMPSQELGAPAHRKYDVESWMYGKQIWGEISSCSNCTDYQSRRLKIKYARPDGSLRHVHTVNGTACAVPRMIISILEQNQSKGRRLELPEVLHPYMDGQTHLQFDVKNASYTYIKTLRDTSTGS